MDNMSLSDIAAVTRNVDGDGWGAGGGWIMIILFALIFGGNGLWGNNNRGNAVTEADLCNANSFSELKNSVGRLSDQVGGHECWLYQRPLRFWLHHVDTVQRSGKAAV